METSDLEHCHLSLVTKNTITIRNIWTPEKSAVTTLKFEQGAMSLKEADGLANSVDPDQTARRFRCALFAETYLSENLGSLQYVT